MNAITNTLTIALMSAFLASCGTATPTSVNGSESLAVKESETSTRALVSIAMEKEAGGSSDILACGYEVDLSQDDATLVKTLSQKAYSSRKADFTQTLARVVGGTFTVGGNLLGVLTAGGSALAIPVYPPAAYGVLAGFQLMAISTITGVAILGQAQMEAKISNEIEAAIVAMMSGETITSREGYAGYKRAIKNSGNSSHTCQPVKTKVLSALVDAQ